MQELEIVLDECPDLPEPITWTITDEATCREANLWIKEDLKPRRKAVADFFAQLKRPVQAALDNIRKIEKDRLGVIDSIIKSGEDAMRAWMEADRRRREEEAEAAAAKLRELQEKKALKLAEQGREAEAEALLAQGVTVPVAQSVKPAGVTTARLYSAEVTDFVALVRWAGQDPESRALFLLPNQPELNAVARSRREALTIPGVVVRLFKSIR